MANDTIIDVKNLNKSFKGKPAVRNLSLQVKKGEIYGFLGPNGSGKTTTIRMLCGLLTPDKAEGQCLGYDLLKQSREIKKQVGYMTQRFSLYEDLSIRENLDFITRLYQMPHRRELIDETMKSFGLTERQHQLARTLSGGWKQRLALSAALIHRPRLLLLDEPTAGVDPKARREFWDTIHQLAHQGITILVSTHYMDEAERCTQLAYILAGTVLVKGTEQEIIKHSGLTTWKVTVENPNQLASELRRIPDIQVAAFGRQLHVSTFYPQKIALLIKHYSISSEGWASIPSSLEDVFIALVSQSDRGAQHE